MDITSAFFLICMLGYIQGESYTYDEGRLYRYFFETQRYNRYVRPVREEIHAVEVMLGFQLMSILEVNEHRQYVAYQVRLSKKWNDYQLAWDPDDYGGLKQLSVPINLIWKPDVVPYNSAREHGSDIIQDTMAVVKHDGTVSWLPVANYLASCSMNLYRFPRDTQICTIKFGSWTYDGSKLNLTSMYNSVQMAMYTPHQEWTIEDSDTKRSVLLYECCPEPYIDITYTLTLKRKPEHFITKYVSPSLLLAPLTLMVLLLPHGDGSKITLGIGVLICETLLLQYFGSVFPVDISVPLLVQYYVFVYVMTWLCLIISTITANLSKTTSVRRVPPEFLKQLLLVRLGRCLCTGYGSYGGIQDQSSAKSHSSEWYQIAQAIDRVFCYIFLILHIIFAIVFLAV